MTLRSPSLSHWLLPALLMAAPIASAMTLDLHDDGAVIFASLKGTIYPDTIEKLHAKLERAVQKKPVAVFIQSGGGAFVAIRPFEKMILALAERSYRLHQKPLLLNFQNACYSGCSILSSLLTKDRDAKTLAIEVAKDTSFGFHGSIIVANGKTDKKATLEAKDELEAQIIRTYLDAGVAPEFIEANKAMFSVHFKQKTFTAGVLCEQKSMVIPPDSCVDNEMEIYKWIVNMTASEEKKKILIPDAPKPVIPKDVIEAPKDEDLLPVENEDAKPAAPFIE